MAKELPEKVELQRAYVTLGRFYLTECSVYVIGSRQREHRSVTYMPVMLANYIKSDSIHKCIGLLTIYNQEHTRVYVYAIYYMDSFILLFRLFDLYYMYSNKQTRILLTLYTFHIHANLSDVVTDYPIWYGIQFIYMWYYLTAFIRIKLQTVLLFYLTTPILYCTSLV